MGSQGINFLYFQRARTLAGSWGILRLATSTHNPQPSARKTSHISETTFTDATTPSALEHQRKAAYTAPAASAKSRVTHAASLLSDCAPVLLACSLLLCPRQMSASDVDGPRQPSANETASTPSTSQPSSTAVVKPPKSDKYDVDRIGQRNVSRGVNVYSLERERAMGQAMAAVIDRGTTFVADPEVTRYVTELAQKLARHSDAEVPFKIKVIDSLNRRVFALPGGILYVDKGLIVDLDNEAELAALIAHEIAHVAARHATRYATRKQAWNVLSIPIMWASGPAALGAQQIGPLDLKKFARDAELEADLLGIEYQYAAGYDPQAFVEALERLSGLENQRRVKAPTAKSSLHNQIARAFASYPPTDERIQKVQTEILTFLPERNDYILDTSAFQQVKTRLGDRPVLRRNRSADNRADGPVLRRLPTLQSESPNLATQLPVITKGRLPLAFSYLSHSRY